MTVLDSAAAKSSGDATASRRTLADNQWKKITDRLKLPDTARGYIEREITWYRELDSVWCRPPGQVSKNLKVVAKAASKLADLLEGLEEQERIELIEAWPTEPSLLEEQFGRIDTAILRTRIVAIACGAAEISKLKQTDRIDGLIERLDSILRQFLGVGVSQANAEMTFLVEIFKAAGIDLKERSIRFAVGRFNSLGKTRS